MVCCWHQIAYCTLKGRFRYTLEESCDPVFMRFFHRPSLWLILAGLVAPLSPALAQTSGQFALTGSYTYSYDQIQQGRTTFTAGSLEGGVIVSSGQGPLFPEGQSFLRSCVVFSEESAGNLSVKAPCTLMESNKDGGDELFALLTREQGDLGAANRGGMGHVKLVGGTGKYANIAGQCSYETRYLSASTGIITWDCTWSKP